MSEHERLRRKLWIKVAVVVAASDFAITKESPGNWADATLEAFDKAFAKEKVK